MDRIVQDLTSKCLDDAIKVVANEAFDEATTILGGDDDIGQWGEIVTTEEVARILHTHTYIYIIHT